MTTGESTSCRPITMLSALSITQPLLPSKDIITSPFNLSTQTTERSKNLQQTKKLDQNNEQNKSDSISNPNLQNLSEKKLYEDRKKRAENNYINVLAIVNKYSLSHEKIQQLFKKINARHDSGNVGDSWNKSNMVDEEKILLKFINVFKIVKYPWIKTKVEEFKKHMEEYNKIFDEIFDNMINTFNTIIEELEHLLVMLNNIIRQKDGAIAYIEQLLTSLKTINHNIIQQHIPAIEALHIYQNEATTSNVTTTRELQVINNNFIRPIKSVLYIFNLMQE